MATPGEQKLQRLTGSYAPEVDSFKMDSSYRVELPERNSTFMEHRSDGGTSPMTSPGLGSVLSAESEGKEMYQTFGIRNSAEKEMVSPSIAENEGKEVARSPPERRKRPWLFLIIGAIACLVIGLAVGLGVGLTRKSTTTAPPKTLPSSGGANSSYLSTVGAFNGSGIALASQSFSSGGYGSIVMYFQHHTGQLRQAQLGSDGTWKGGDITQVVAADAKNGTPIAAVAYARNNTAAWHIFYISVNNTVREVTNSNTTNVWIPGPINNLNLQAMDDPNVGLEACWYGSFYSDEAYNHSPVPGQTITSTGNSSDQTVGIHLWYATNSTSFDSVGWTYGDTAWTQQQTFNGYNGHGGVGCYSWGPGSDTYVFFVNPQNEVNILWKDLNTTIPGNSSHPINVWTKTKIAIPVFQNTSMGYTNYLYAQNSDLSISGYNISWAAENTSIPTSQTFTINGAKGLPGTHLSVTALPNSSGGNSLLAFYQVNGTDITEFVRDLDVGQWTSTSVPIPQS
ncbi:hypothetical protein N7G274_008745 [Stereocaulon virgatum]|uniref:Fucose-specific lectin n=1 Tax=Stereocaulon virgatum TaxID=373712 RepID=A0ABR4A0B7_9LECA